MEIQPATAGQPTVPAGISRRSIRLADIVEMPAYQAREGVDLATVKRYATAMAQGAVFPPVKVGLLDGALVLLAGAHRVRAAARVGLLDIQADVFEVDHAGATRIALGDNLLHGLSLSKRELRRSLLLFLDAGLNKLGRGRVMSSRVLATEALGGAVHHTTVVEWVNHERPKVAAMMRRQAPTNARGTRFDHVAAAQARAVDAALKGAEAVVAAMRGVSAPDARGRVIRALEQAVELAKLAGPYELPPAAPAGPDDF